MGQSLLWSSLSKHWSSWQLLAEWGSVPTEGRRTPSPISPPGCSREKTALSSELRLWPLASPPRFTFQSPDSFSKLWEDKPRKLTPTWNMAYKGEILLYFSVIQHTYIWTFRARFLFGNCLYYTEKDATLNHPRTRSIVSENPLSNACTP